MKDEDVMNGKFNDCSVTYDEKDGFLRLCIQDDVTPPAK